MKHTMLNRCSFIDRTKMRGWPGALLNRAVHLPFYDGRGAHHGTCGSHFQIRVLFRSRCPAEQDVRGAQANPLRAVVLRETERHVLLENGVRDEVN